MLDRTPFYAEGGGQLADAGRDRARQRRRRRGRRRAVADHGPDRAPRAACCRGEVDAGAAGARRWSTSSGARRSRRAHTATHMVHKAIREALGDTATQAGSENAPGRFRFDFCATGGRAGRRCWPTSRHEVNAVLAEDLAVHAEIMTPGRRPASSGAMALFGEKYGDEVRVVSVGDWARELCGGTHAQRSGQLGLVKLLGESSIGSGVRRVEALVGADAYDFLAREHALVAPAHRGAQGAPRGAARAGRRHRRPAAGRRARDRRTMRQQQVLAAAGRAGRRRAGRLRRRASSATTPATASAPTTCARWRWTCAAGSATTGPASSRWPAWPRTGPVVVVATNERGPRSGASRAGDLVKVAAAGPRRRRRRQGRRGPGRRHRRDQGRRGAGRGVEHAVGERVTGRSLSRCAPACGSASTWAASASGVAASDPAGLLATPVRDAAAGPRRRRRPGRDRGGWCGSAQALEVVVGLPRSLSGQRGSGRGAGPRLRRPARGARRAGAGAPRRRAADHGGCSQHAARQWGRRTTAARRGRPGGGRAHPAGRPGRRTRHGGTARGAGRARRRRHRRRPARPARPRHASPGTGQEARTDEGPAPRELDLRRPPGGGRHLGGGRDRRAGRGVRRRPRRGRRRVPLRVPQRSPATPNRRPRPP